MAPLFVISDLWLKLSVPHFLICTAMIIIEPTVLCDEEFSEVSHIAPHNRPGTWSAPHGIWIDSGPADGGE